MPNIELQSGEFLLFEKKVKSEASIVLNYIAGITVLIIISILLYLGSSITFDDWMAMIIISTVILVLVFGFYSNKNGTIIFTNKRLFFSSLYSFRKETVWYEKVYGFDYEEALHDFFLLRLTPSRLIGGIGKDEDGKYFKRFIRPDLSKEEWDIILNAWFKESVYEELNKIMGQEAERKGMDFMPLEREALGQKITIRHERDGMAFFFELRNTIDYPSILIQAECPNPENNYIRISQEDSIDKISHFFGGKDIQTGNSLLDGKMLLESDNSSFLKDILDENIQENILKTSEIINYTISMGTPTFSNKKEKKKKWNQNENLLDADVIMDDMEIMKRDGNNKTRLVLKSEDIKEIIMNPESFSKALFSLMNIHSEISRNISDYANA